MIKHLFRLLPLLLLSAALVAQNATPTNVSSISVSGNSATVNDTAHGLVVGQGVCLSTQSICGVVTSQTANQFVSLMASTPSACASSCGTASAAPKVIALNTPVQDQGHVTFQYALWLTTTQACPGTAASAWIANSTAGSNGASAAQKNAIGAGLFVEKVKPATFPANTPIANIQAQLQNDYAMEQQALANNVQPCQYYGFVFDGVGWAKQ